MRRIRLIDHSPALAGAVRTALPAGWEATDGPAEVDVACLPSAGRPRLKSVGLLGEREDAAVPLIVVVAKVPTPTGMRVLSSRVEGVLLADDLGRTLPPTLLAVAAGMVAIPRSFMTKLRRPELSPREKQILAMVVLDASNAEIARRLFVTEKAVKNHLTSAFAKLGVQSRSAAAELLVDPEGGLGLGVLRITPETSDETGT